MMIMDKYIATVVPVMNYAPWDGINVADFVPPTFLFLVGVSKPLSQISHPRSKIAATAHALRRSVWLFGLCVLPEGGLFHDKERLRFGIDVGEFRVMGTLQRLAVACLGTTLCEIWAPTSGHWALTALIPGASAAVLYGLHVPDWSFPRISVNTINDKFPGNGDDSTVNIIKVTCGAQGFYNTEPACNAAAYLEGLTLGLKQLNPVAWYKHLPVCRENQGDPDWCFAPFESEGILTTFAATATTLIGLHVGHVTAEKKQHLARLWSWTLPSTSLVVVGLALELQLHVLHGRHGRDAAVVGVLPGGGTRLAWGISPMLQVVGRHSLLLFGLFQCDVLRTMLQGVYHRCPEYNLFSYLRDHHFAHRILKLTGKRVLPLSK